MPARRHGSPRLAHDEGLSGRAWHQLWISTATRAALPADGAYERFQQASEAEYADDVAAHFMWLLAEVGQQSGDLDVQVATAWHRALRLQHLFVRTA